LAAMYVIVAFVTCLLI